MHRLFEFSLARRYLLPKRRHLSLSLIAFLSVGVIALVVWLVVVFLSVTEGIEKGWLHKLTSLNGPLRITPKDAYFASYYYQVDAFSEASDYSLKTVSEKLKSRADPYVLGKDPTLPPYFPKADLSDKGEVKNLIGELVESLNEVKKEFPSLVFQDFALSGALMRLELNRPEIAAGSENFLTQIAYVSSFADQSPYLKQLILTPSLKDLKHQLSLMRLKGEGGNLLECIDVKGAKPLYSFSKIELKAMPEGGVFNAFLKADSPSSYTILIPEDNRAETPKGFQLGKVMRKGSELFFSEIKKEALKIPASTPIFFQGKPEFLVKGKSGRHLLVQFLLQGKSLEMQIPLEECELTEAVAKTDTINSPWTHLSNGTFILPIKNGYQGVLLPKHFQESGVLIGDKGYFSYPAHSPTGGTEEQRLKIYVAGFYDPGAMMVGNRCVLAPSSIPELINAESQTYKLDRNLSSGFQVWFSDLTKAKTIKARLQEECQKRGIEGYFECTTYHDYEFAKDLLQQFQSDKVLFTLVGGIVLLVACCNIISLLFVLVNDKKHEIGILLAMGASKRSIATIFATIGIAMGAISSLIGTLLAYFTMHNIDGLAHLLSFLQGHEVFNALFYGKSLPKAMSQSALTFVLIATPILSFGAALVPALRACRFNPSSILRSEI